MMSLLSLFVTIASFGQITTSTLSGVVKNAFAPKGTRKKRPGVIAKTKNSGLKSSKNYKKPYRGQGR